MCVSFVCLLSLLQVTILLMLHTPVYGKSSIALANEIDMHIFLRKATPSCIPVSGQGLFKSRRGRAGIVIMLL